MALVTWEDFQQPAASNASIQVHQLADMRVHNTLKPMPPSPQRLPENDRAVIAAWLAAGAPAGTDASCAPQVPTDAGTGTATTVAPPVDQGICYKLLAHGQWLAGDTSPYPVNSEHYVNFYFDAPWAADAQGISFKSVLDDHPEIVHHWLLYIAGGGFYPLPQADGTVESNTNGSHLAATLIAGWAPGGNNGDPFPLDVGMDINGASRKLVLEIHFYPNGGSFMSRSGVEVCTTKTPRPNVATVSWLGTESINIPGGQRAAVTGTCAPSTTQPIHILRTWPHMHRLGVHMATAINRKAGGTEMLLDEDFNFNTQIAYSRPMTLDPGDTLSTTCTYQNDTAGPVGYGTSTNQEMCFNFVTAYPANLLTHGTAMNGSTNPCMN